MPLPTGNPVWPPPEVAAANRRYREWAAWYCGDTGRLAAVYEETVSTIGPDLKSYGAPGGLASGAPQRMFWGQTPLAGNALQMARVHVPLAGDIASTSADLLFGERPKPLFGKTAKTPGEPGGDKPFGQRKPGSGVVAPDPAQVRADMLLDEGGLHAVLLEAAELGAAYGGVYLRAGWDEAVAEHAIVDAICPDRAVPEWRSGYLTAVTFWRVLDERPRSSLVVADASGRITDRKVYRHLERHEKGRIFHGLYAGTDDKLGDLVDLREHPETEQFATLVGAAGYVETGAPNALSVEYVPNMKPGRVMPGSALGRSDYQGIVPLLDNLDEAWSSWMRDLRLGKARLIVPTMYLENQGRGQGAVFDAEREVYETIDAMPASEGITLQEVQFAIRVVEHKETTAALKAEILRGAGYSVQTFGEAGDGIAATATEVVAREKRSFTTRGRKIGYWTPRLSRHLQTLMQIDAAKFKSTYSGERPSIEWPDGVAIDPMQTAQTVQMLRAAEVISIRTGVTMVHPEWEPEQVEEEVERIREDQKAAMPEVPEPGAGGFPGKPGDGADRSAAPPTRPQGAPNRFGRGAPPNRPTGKG